MHDDRQPLIGARTAMKAPMRPGYRWVVLALGCFANIISYTDRSSLSLAVVPMSEELPYFTAASQGMALSAFYTGYMLTQVPGGILSRRYGPYRVVIAAVAMWSVATLLLPPAATTSLSWLFLARAALGCGEGLLLPCLHDLAQAWVPPTERSTSVALMTCGQFLGTITSLLSAPLVAACWPAIFYIWGGIGLGWCVLFGVLGATFLLTVAGLFMKKGSGLQGVLRPTDDFLSARNRYKWPTLALSFFASGMGAWVIYGSPEMGAIRTTSWWGVLGYSSASAAGGWVLMWLGPVVKRKVGEDKGFSAVDFALTRYGRLMQLLVMGVSTFYMFIYVVAELTTIANVYATFVGKSTVGTDSEHYTTKISSIVVIFTWAYTALAGLPASILTDKFQGVTISIFVIMLLIATTTLKSNEVPARRP